VAPSDVGAAGYQLTADVDGTSVVAVVAEGGVLKEGGDMKIAMKHPIDLSKGLTAPVIVGMMWWFDNFTVGPWVYLALHGSYGVMWIVKSRTYFFIVDTLQKQ
jgi:hypothetical protein